MGGKKGRKMKEYLSIIPLVLILCVVVGCQDKAAMAELEEFRAQVAVEEQNRQLIERYFKELDEYLALAQKGTGDLSFLDKFFAPDYALHTALSDIRGLEAFKEYVASAPKRWSNSLHVLEENFAEGNIVVSRGYFQAIQTGEFLGLSASGKQVRSPTFWIHRIEDSKIKECWMDWDSLFGLTQQLDMELKPKGEK